MRCGSSRKKGKGKLPAKARMKETIETEEGESGWFRLEKRRRTAIGEKAYFPQRRKGAKERRTNRRTRMVYLALGVSLRYCAFAGKRFLNFSCCQGDLIAESFLPKLCELQCFSRGGAQRNRGQFGAENQRKSAPGSRDRSGPHREGVVVVRDGMAKLSHSLAARARRAVPRAPATPRIPPCGVLRLPFGARAPCRRGAPTAARPRWLPAPTLRNFTGNWATVPAASARQPRAIGHSRHRGFAGRQTVAPNSIRA